MKDSQPRKNSALRTAVNVAMLIVIVGVSTAAGYTISSASTTSGGMPGGTPPNMSQDGNSNGGPGGNMGTPPARPGEDSNTDNSNNSNANSSDNNTDSSSNEQSNDMGTPPDLPSDNNNSGVPGQMPSSDQDTQSANVNLEASDYITLGVEAFIVALFSMYLILSNFNQKSPKETLKGADKVLICLFSTLIAGAAIFGIDILIANLHP